MPRVAEVDVARLIALLGGRFGLSDFLLNDIGAFAEKSDANFNAVKSLANEIEPGDNSAPSQLQALLRKSNV